jgi:hypothetical protein
LKKLSLTIFTNNFITTLLGNFPHEIESMTKNYPELQGVNLNYAGGHAWPPDLNFDL